MDMDTDTKDRMTLSEELLWRGMIHQTTLTDVTTLDTKPIVFYHGFDASAPSQTVGNLAAMMVDLVFLRHGHTAIILAGGSTSLIGDPGGKDKERPMQSIQDIEANVLCAKKQIEKIYREHDFTLVNNIDWTKKVSLLDFLRDVGKYFNVGEMVKKDYIATRIGGDGISYTEFSYALLQGYDFLHLYQNFNCTLQIGGSDQWSNCLAGVELIRRKLEKEVHCVTLPLVINKTTGKKFGKSESGAVWLDPEKTSPYDFYQFWLNVDDESVKDYLKIFTAIDKKSYDQLIEEFQKDRSSRLAQKYLAFSVTELVHGHEQAQKAKNTTEVLFGNTIDINTADIQEILLLSSDVVDGYIDIVEFLSSKNVVKSKREARDLITSKGVYIDNQVLETVKISEKDLKKSFLLRIGKKKYFKIIKE